MARVSGGPVNRECGLCGERSPDVRTALVRWLDGSFDAVDRCRDVESCFRRVTSRGETWPLSDAQYYRHLAEVAG